MSRRETPATQAKRRASLRAIREGLGKTQVDVARVLSTNQGEVSRIERRQDLMLSTMRRYAQALGARCEVAFVFRGGRRVLVLSPEAAE
jgi:transcriptional regulator with XRE-family HTH domain